MCGRLNDWPNQWKHFSLIGLSLIKKKTTNFYLLMNIYDLINTSIDTKIPL